MKRYFSFLTIALLTAATFTSVSCKDPITGPEPGPDATKPVFPTAVTESLEAGGEYTLDIEANADWIIELKYDKESTGWFWIQDGNSQVYTVRGKAGEKASVTVCAGDQTDFDTVHSCTLEMIMGEEAKTIATFTRGTVERTFALAYCKVEGNGGDYVYSDGGDFLYSYNDESAGNEAIPLVWLQRTQDYRRSVLITANFDWQFKSKPEWVLDLEVAGGDAGETVEVEIEGNPAYYPLDDSAGEIIFCAKENMDAEYVYAVTIPGSRSFFSVSGFKNETRADADGAIYNDGSMGEGAWMPQETGLSGTITATEGIAVYTFSYVEGVWDGSVENTAWINVELAPWNPENGVLQSRDLTIKVTPNDGAERKACVIAIPEAVVPENDDMIFPDGQTVADEYKDYVVTTVVQTAAGSSGDDPGISVEPITFAFETLYNYPIPEEDATLELVTESNLETLMEKYAKYDKLNISDYWGGTSATYILTYYSSNQSMNQLYIPDFLEWLSITCTPEGEWLTCEPMENGLNVLMSKPAADASQNYGIIQIFITASRSYTIICLPEL